MKTKEEVSLLLKRVEKIIQRIQLVENPPEYFKMENCEYRILLTQRDFYDWMLGGSGYDIDGAYQSIEKSLDELENR